MKSPQQINSLGILPHSLISSVSDEDGTNDAIGDDSSSQHRTTDSSEHRQFHGQSYPIHLSAHWG